MRRTRACVVSGMALFTAGSAVLAAPEQGRSGQDYPGRPTQAKVWVQNQGKGEALPVQLVDTATVMISPASIIQSLYVRQAWEYRVVNVMSSDQGPLRGELTNAGADGWETSGHQFPIPGGTALLLKRPAELRELRAKSTGE